MKPRPRLVRASIARGIIDDDSVRVTVVDAEKNKVEYNGEATSLSPLAEKLRNVQPFRKLRFLHTTERRLLILQKKRSGKRKIHYQRQRLMTYCKTKQAKKLDFALTVYFVSAILQSTYHPSWSSSQDNRKGAFRAFFVFLLPRCMIY